MHDIAHAAADAARVPDYDQVLRKGRRRRNVRAGLAAGAAALSVAAVVGVGQLLGSTGSSEPEPAPSPPTTVIEDGPAVDSPEWIVDHRDARIADAALTEGGATAVFWRVVDHERWAMAISDDGFSSRSLDQLAIPGVVVAAGDRFVVCDQARTKVFVVDAQATRTRVEVAGPEAPVSNGEVPTWTSRGLVAVDPATARAHPVDAPGGAYVVNAYGGRLTAITSTVDGSGERVATYHWSDDGGASWQATSFDAGELGNPQVVPTAAGTDHVVLMLGDGATIGPLTAVLTMDLDAGVFTQIDYQGELASQTGAFVVDGELRLLADLRGDGSGPRESGLYRWVDGQLQRIESTAPAVTDVEDRALVDVLATAGGPALLVAVDNRLFASDDGGATWGAVAAR